MHPRVFPCANAAQTHLFLSTNSGRIDERGAQTPCNQQAAKPPAPLLGQKGSGTTGPDEWQAWHDRFTIAPDN